MISNREDLRMYLAEDWKARFPKGARKTSLAYWSQRPLWQFNRCLRMAEYYGNVRGALHRLPLLWYRLRLNRLGLKLGWLIPLNAFGPGLCVVHPGTVVVNSAARIGKGARVHVSVSIGAGHGGAPVIGDYAYIGPGARIYGGVTLGAHVNVGCNAVVNRSFPQEYCLLVGIPAVCKRVRNAATEQDTAE